MKPVCRRREERGFALLFVFVMAAVIAITLYMEMPRVAFESQRSREQLLVDRGNEYKRGIQLYYRKMKRFPSKLEDLESTNNMRFLRRRYKDPLTGKDEWRIIHVGPGGFLTDSLVQKPNPLGKDQKDVLAGSGSPGNTPSTSDSANGQQPGPLLNANGTEGGGGINMATARRPSDQMIVAAQAGGAGVTATNPADPNQPVPPQYPAAPQNPGQQPQFPGQYLGPLLGQQGQGQPGQPAQLPGQPFGRGLPTPPPFPGQPGFPGQPSQTGFPPGQLQPGQSMTFQQGQPAQVYPNQPAAGGQFPGNQQQGAFAPPAGFGNGQPNAAIAAIQNSLFSPRPPPAGLTGTPQNGLTGGGVAIAGVATTYKGEGIKRINEKSKYQEWEFVYDLKKDKTIMGNAAGQQMPPTQQPVLGPGNTPFSPASPNGPTGPTPSPGLTGRQQR